MGAALSGGDFWQGAGIGASIALLNHAAHRVLDGPQEEDGPGPKGRKRGGYKPAPKKLDGFPDAKRVKTKNGRARWRTSDGKILEWDSQHGDIEVYNKQGKHLGSAQSETGKLYKPPVSGRTLNKITETAVKGTAIVIVGIAVYQSVKWGAAIFFVPETGGLSLSAAAALP